MTIDDKLDLLIHKVTQLEVRMDSMEADMELMKADINSVKADMEFMKRDMEFMKTDTELMKTDMELMKTDMNSMKADMNSMKTDLDSTNVELRQTRFIMENELNRNIRLVAENHIDLSRKLDEAIKVSETDMLYHMKVNSVDSEIRRIKDKCQMRFQEFQRFQEVQAAALN